MIRSLSFSLGLTSLSVIILGLILAAAGVHCSLWSRLESHLLILSTLVLHNSLDATQQHL